MPTGSRWCMGSPRDWYQAATHLACTKEGEMSMPADGEQPAHHTLLQRLRSSYISATLTILSIIQGVALAALGVTVAAHALRLTPAQWVMVTVTFGALI